MNAGAGRAGWRRAIDAYLAKFQRPDIQFGQLVLLWVTALTLVVVACAIFFIVMYWLFS